MLFTIINLMIRLFNKVFILFMDIYTRAYASRYHTRTKLRWYNYVLILISVYIY